MMMGADVRVLQTQMISEVGSEGETAWIWKYLAVHVGPGR